MRRHFQPFKNVTDGLTGRPAHQSALVCSDDIVWHSSVMLHYTSDCQQCKQQTYGSRKLLVATNTMHMSTLLECWWMSLISECDRKLSGERMGEKKEQQRLGIPFLVIGNCPQKTHWSVYAISKNTWKKKWFNNSAVHVRVWALKWGLLISVACGVWMLFPLRSGTDCLGSGPAPNWEEGISQTAGPLDPCPASINRAFKEALLIIAQPPPPQKKRSQSRLCNKT